MYSILATILLQTCS